MKEGESGGGGNDTGLVYLQAERAGQDPKEATEVQLYMQMPPIEKMDASLSTLVNCE